MFNRNDTKLQVLTPVLTYAGMPPGDSKRQNFCHVKKFTKIKENVMLYSKNYNLFIFSIIFKFNKVAKDVL